MLRRQRRNIQVRKYQKKGLTFRAKVASSRRKLSLPPSLSLSLSLPPSLSLSLSFFRSHGAKIWDDLPPDNILRRMLSASLSVSVSVCVCLSPPLYLSLSFPLPPSTPRPLSLSLPPPPPLSLSPPLSPSLVLYYNIITPTFRSQRWTFLYMFDLYFFHCPTQHATFIIITYIHTHEYVNIHTFH